MEIRSDAGAPDAFQILRIYSNRFVAPQSEAIVNGALMPLRSISQIIIINSIIIIVATPLGLSPVGDAASAETETAVLAKWLIVFSGIRSECKDLQINRR